MTFREQWVIDIDNPIVRHHRVLDQSVLPGLAYIDVFFQMFRSQGYDSRQLSLHNVSIYQPLVVADGVSILLDIECTEVADNRWKLVIDGHTQQDGRVTVGPARYVTAE